jgi:hypothetical protein
LLFLFAGALVDLVSNFSGRGTIIYRYTSGGDAIVSITYTLPQDLADAMVPEQTVGWTVNVVGNVLSVTGGTLNPGGIVAVDFRLDEYIEGGTRTITATATTASGSTVPSVQYPLEIDVFLLGLVLGLYQNAIWLLILAIIVLVIIIVLFRIGKKKDKEQEQEEMNSTDAQEPS